MCRQHREEAVSKWEEGKKLQKKVETLQTRIKEKDLEVEKLVKTNDMLKHALDRLISLNKLGNIFIVLLCIYCWL